MKVIVQTTFRCDTCQKMIVGQLVSPIDEELPLLYEKNMALEHLKHNHQIEAVVSCWKCKRYVATHEIEDLIWAYDSWKDLCKKCLEY